MNQSINQSIKRKKIESTMQIRNKFQRNFCNLTKLKLTLSRNLANIAKVSLWSFLYFALPLFWWFR